MGRGGNVNIPQAVHHQQAHHGCRQRPTQIFHHFRHGFAVREQQEGEKAGDDGAQCHSAHNDQCLSCRQCHSFFLPISSTASISTMAGITS